MPHYQAQELPVRAIISLGIFKHWLTLHHSLAAVNFFLGLVGVVQVSRILSYESEKKKGLHGVVEDIKADAKETIQEVKP